MIWIDITNPPHVMFFKEFIRSMEDDEVLVTSRDFGNLREMLNKHRIDNTPVGSHGGRDIKDKLIESSTRATVLAELISEIAGKVHLAISKHSVELPRVAFGLGIPVLQFVDNEHAEHQNKLFLPLCHRIIVPDALERGKLLMQGASWGQLQSFKGICEVANIGGFQPSRDVALPSRNYVLIRPEPSSAAYFRESSLTQKLIKSLVEIGYECAVIPRGSEEYDGAVNVKNIDSLSLIYHAKAFLGGGGTMNRESALLGTPTISYYPQELLGVDKYLIEKGLMEHATDLNEILVRLSAIEDKKIDMRTAAETELKNMEHPLEALEKEISSLMAHSS
ncbi:MAG: DUF354 domain-containing protein [Candidatus Hydrothermarchaeales archaeon]